MIITDFNKMTLEELDIINYHLGIEMEINDGRIVNTDKVNALASE